MSDEGSKFKPSETIKKMLAAGVGTLFLTEESLRKLLSELKFPAELLGSFLESANRTRKEFLQNLSQDLLSRVSEKMDPKAFVSEILSQNEIKLEISVKFTPKTSRSPDSRFNDSKSSDTYANDMASDTRSSDSSDS